MSSVLFTQTLKDKALGAILAATLLLVFMLFVCSMYSQISAQFMNTPGYEELLNNPAISAVLGKSATMATFEGFLALFSFSYLGLLVGGYIAFVTASFLSGEIEQKTIDLLLSLPIKRETLVLWRFAVLVLIVALLMITVFVAILVGGRLAGLSTSPGWLACTLVFLGLFALAFGAISLLISALMSDGMQAAIISIGLLFVMYFLETIGESVPSLDVIRDLSLFHYANVKDILISHTISFVNIGVLLVVLVVFLALATFAFKMRDINVT